MIPLHLPASRFCEHMVAHNNLLEQQFAQWAFYPGMLFLSRERWWGNDGYRHNPHEGIDLCLFNTVDGSTQVLDTGTQIPAMFRGYVKTVIDDYLGKTIFIAHDMYDGTEKQLYTIYGHTVPVGRLEREAVLAEGDCVGFISSTSDKQLHIIPHVHISVAWIPVNFPPEQLKWKIMNKSPDITLLNPLDVLSCNYTIIRERTYTRVLCF